MRRISKRKERTAAAADRRSGRDAARVAGEREPTYAQADLTVQSREVPHDAIVAEIMTALAAVLKTHRSRERPAHDGTVRSDPATVKVALGAQL
jgi:hypothetical protein